MTNQVNDPVNAPSVPTEMNAVVLDRFGDLDELSFRRIPVPQLGDDDVLIRVEYAGLGSWDTHERADGFVIAGREPRFPYVLGWDGAGTIAAMGRNVTRFELGDRVYAATIPALRPGFYAQYAAVEAEHVAHIPARLSTQQAAAMPWDALTALIGLDVLGLQPGQRLMVFGASGGIGHMTVQLARHAGVKVLAVVSGEDGVAWAESVGAEAVVDGRRDDVLAAVTQFAPDGLDAALVTVGGETAERSLQAVKASGQIAWPNDILPALGVSPAARVTYYDGDRSRVSTERLNAIVEASAFEVHVPAEFPLDRAQDAHRALREHYVGKMVLKIS